MLAQVTRTYENINIRNFFQMLFYTIDCHALLMNLLQCELHKVYMLNTHVTWILLD